jgi:anti-sigma-K factor RskA
MTPPAASDPIDENDLLAAEYALGVLEGADRRRAEGLIKQSPAFAARFAAWEARLSPLADEIDPVPAPNLLPKIEQRLFGAPKLRRWFTMPTGWLGGLIGTGAMAALSVVVLALLLNFGGTAPQTPAQTATLLAQGSSLEFLARLEGGNLTLTRTKGSPPAPDRSYELWLIDGDKPPVSLGLIDAALTLPAPNLPIGYVLAITDEPFGGGPNGVASGPIVAAGMFVQEN